MPIDFGSAAQRTTYAQHQAGDELRALGSSRWNAVAAPGPRPSAAADLRVKTGRSVLYELDDRELDQLVSHVLTHVPDAPLVERDPWTVWIARREPRSAEPTQPPRGLADR